MRPDGGGSLPPPDPEDTVSFSVRIIPIFENNNCTACHFPGGGFSQLDLTAANAYNSIIGLGLVNTEDPESSKIYIYPHPSLGSHSAKYQSETEVQYILQWIQQGALNNK